MQITLSDEFAADLEHFCEVRLQTIRTVSLHKTDDALILAAMRCEKHLLQGLLDAFAKGRVQ